MKITVTDNLAIFMNEENNNHIDAFSPEELTAMIDFCNEHSLTSEKDDIITNWQLKGYIE
jgi:hypothetical protein